MFITYARTNKRLPHQLTEISSSLPNVGQGRHHKGVTKRITVFFIILMLIQIYNSFDVGYPPAL